MVVFEHVIIVLDSSKRNTKLGVAVDLTVEEVLEENKQLKAQIAMYESRYVSRLMKFFYILAK